MPTTEEFYDPGTFTWTVPAGVTSIDVQAGGAAQPSPPVFGELRSGRMTVAPGEQLTIQVGGPASRRSTIRRAASSTLVVDARGGNDGTGSSPGLTSASLSSWFALDGFVGLTYDRPPNAPSLVAPEVDAVLDRNVGHRFSWVHSDPDGDPQGRYEFQHRAAGTTPSEADVATTPNQFRDVAAGAFPVGGREWRVRTRGQSGDFGPFSSWRPFLVADKPSDLTIVAPVSGATVTANPTLLQWSAVDQDAFQVRVEGDTTFDTGVVVDAAARSYPVPVTAADPGQTWQVRIRHLGLWSDWASVVVNANPTPPAVPTVLVDDTAVRGAILIGQTHPDPSGNEPAVSHAELWRRRQHPNGNVDDPVRIATNLDPAGQFTDWTVASGVTYAYRLVAVATTGARSASDWDGSTSPDPDPIPDPDPTPEQPPVASFTMTPAPAVAGSPVTLDGSASQRAVTWMWDDAVDINNPAPLGTWLIPPGGGAGLQQTYTWNTADRTQVPRLTVYNADGLSHSTMKELYVGGSTSYPPSVAPNPAGTVVGTSQINWTWNALTNATGYKVRLDGGAWVDVGNVTSYADTGFTLDVARTFAVLAYNTVGDGPASATISRTVESDSPPPSVSSRGPDGTHWPPSTPAWSSGATVTVANLAAAVTAVASASPGDVIVVQNGSGSGTINFNAGPALGGSNVLVRAASPLGHVHTGSVTISTPGVTVAGFELSSNLNIMQTNRSFFARIRAASVNAQHMVNSCTDCGYYEVVCPTYGQTGASAGNDDRFRFDANWATNLRPRMVGCWVKGKWNNLSASDPHADTFQAWAPEGVVDLLLEDCVLMTSADKMAQFEDFQMSGFKVRNCWINAPSTRTEQPGSGQGTPGYNQAISGVGSGFEFTDCDILGDVNVKQGGVSGTMTDVRLRGGTAHGVATKTNVTVSASFGLADSPLPPLPNLVAIWT